MMVKNTYPIAAFQDKAIAGHRPSSGFHKRAVATGEYRPPKSGEWYLSGAIVEAYYAPNDLSTDYAIARIVTCRQVWEVVDE